jgi:hypothetical protein
LACGGGRFLASPLQVLLVVPNQRIRLQSAFAPSENELSFSVRFVRFD